MIILMFDKRSRQPGPGMKPVRSMAVAPQLLVRSKSEPHTDDYCNGDVNHASFWLKRIIN